VIAVTRTARWRAARPRVVTRSARPANVTAGVAKGASIIAITSARIALA
jgi:hypothetical protein